MSDLCECMCEYIWAMGRVLSAVSDSLAPPPPLPLYSSSLPHPVFLHISLLVYYLMHDEKAQEYFREL